MHYELTPISKIVQFEKMRWPRADWTCNLYLFVLWSTFKFNALTISSFQQSCHILAWFCELCSRVPHYMFNFFLPVAAVKVRLTLVTICVPVQQHLCSILVIYRIRTRMDLAWVVVCRSVIAKSLFSAFTFILPGTWGGILHPRLLSFRSIRELRKLVFHFGPIFL